MIVLGGSDENARALLAALADNAELQQTLLYAIRDDQSLNSALEQLTYLALERHHPGWEINDGACGELIIDVATPSFVLDCQLRYTATDDHSTDL